MKILLHIFVIILLTILTQIGGIVYLFALWIAKKKNLSNQKFIIGFVTLYLIATFILTPLIAPTFGRERVKENSIIEANTFITKLLNRNYVRPKLNNVLQATASEFAKKYPHLKLIYLDANFPFIDRFPLLPHLSHNDGKKIDLAFIYSNKQAKLTNQKPTVSGYGFFITPKKHELNQTKLCKQKGYWQYDYPQYFTFGTLHPDLQLAEKPSKKLIEIITKQAQIGKIFIEPNIKKRLRLSSSKIRFQGCQSVRHDDHIHIQLK
jgi:hypothetical protein